ncbi:MAG: SpoIIIAH-like family protein [Clostridia bacterium]
MSKKKKIIILSVMIALLGVTGFLNIMLNNNLTSISVSSTTASESFYINFRNNRESARQSEISLYDSIIASEKSTESEIADAKQAKLALIAQIEKEVVIEGLIESKLNTDAVFTESQNYVNVVVNKSENELTKEQVAQITKIIVDQTGIDIDNISIVPSAE